MTSLTAPWDRQLIADENVKLIVQQLLLSGVKVSDDQVKLALEDLLDTGFTDKYPKVDKMYADPIYNNQVYCLHSFIPSKGAIPDDKGVYGFMKCRGTFSTVNEANSRAEEIVKTHDTMHEIHTGYCGRPFPVGKDMKKYVAETKEVDVKKHAKDVVSEDIISKEKDRRQQTHEIRDREAKLLEDSKLILENKYEEDPVDVYTTLNVKKANLIWTYKKSQEKLSDMREIIRKTSNDIRKMDRKHPDFRQGYYERYMQARKEAGIPDDDTTDSFIQYMCNDVELDFNY